MRKRLLTALVALSLFGAIYPATAVRAASDDPCAPAEDGSVPEMCQGGVAYPEMGEGFFFSATFTQLVTAGELSRALFNVESGSITFSDGDLSATVGCNNVFGVCGADPW